MTDRTFARRTARTPAPPSTSPAPIVTALPATGDGFRRLQAARGNQAVQALVQGKAMTGAPGDRWERQADRLASRVAGTARGLDDLRTRMEQATGADLSAVRIHTDPSADAVNRSAGRWP